MPISLISYVHTPFSFPYSIKKHRYKTRMVMKVEIQTRKLIKPSLSTPHTFKHYKIGFTDEFAPMANVTLVLFFSPNSNFTLNSIVHLEESLRKALTIFYPLAGRYMEDIHTFDCNDHGAEFIHAQVNMKIQDLLDPKLDPKLIDEFIPRKYWDASQVNEAILTTQLTLFQCGGFALGLCIPHYIGDAFTLCTFINQWATLSQKDSKVEPIGLDFTSSSLFPGQGLTSFTKGITTSTDFDEYVTKKFAFNKIALSKMEEKATLNGKIDTSRLSKAQLVSALLWKVFINVDHEIYGYPRDSVLLQPLNLRKKIVSPKDSFGNLWGLIATAYDPTKMSNGFRELAHVVKDSVMKTIKDYSKLGQDIHRKKEMVLSSFSRLNNMPNDTTNLIWLTSWCKLPIYDINFGYGNPKWISCGCPAMKRGIHLLDDVEGNGVEAYVSMPLKDAPYFEQHADIKAFLT